MEEVSEIQSEEALYREERGGGQTTSDSKDLSYQKGLTIYNGLSESSLFALNNANNIVREQDIFVQKNDLDQGSPTGPVGAFYESIVHQIVFEPGNPLKKHDERVLTISNPLYAKEYRSLHFLFNPDMESVKITSLKVFNAQGQALFEGIPTETHILNAETLKGENFKGLKLLQMFVPDFDSARKIHVILERESLNSVDKMPFLKYLFDSKLPARRHELTIQADKLELLNFHVRGDVQESTSGNKISWLFEDPSVNGEVFDTTQYQQIPMVWIAASSASWEAAGQKYLDEIKAEISPRERTEDLAATLTSNYTGASDKFASVFRYMQSDILFKQQTVIPDISRKIFSVKTEALRQSVLFFYRLLTSAGFRVQIVLVRTQGNLQEDLPAIEQFNHMLLLVNVGRIDYFVDVTYPADQYWELPPGILGKKAFILTSERPYFKKIESR